MFNTGKVGIKIAELRKRKNMTQMELADKMNISFQAISNWERGNSMPDISKLPELAEIFDVTIDEIIGEKSDLLSSVIKDDIDNYLYQNKMTTEELADIAPIIKPSQVDNLFKKAEPSIDLSDLEDIIPYLSQDVVNELFIKLVKNKDLKAIDNIVPFVSTSLLNEIALKNYHEIYIKDFLPFLSQEIVDKIAPFMDKSYLNKLAKEAMEKGGIHAISPIAPFLDTSLLDEFVRDLT